MIDWILYWNARIENFVLIPIIVLLVGTTTYNCVYIELKEFERKERK